MWRVSTHGSIPLQHPCPQSWGTFGDYSVETVALVQASSQCFRHPSMFPPGAGLVRGLAQPPNPDNVQLQDRKNRKGIYCPSMLFLSFSSLGFFFFFFLPLAASNYPWCGSFSSHTDTPVRCVVPLFLGGVLPRAGL